MWINHSKTYDRKEISFPMIETLAQSYATDNGENNVGRSRGGDPRIGSWRGGVSNNGEEQNYRVVTTRRIK